MASFVGVLLLLQLGGVRQFKLDIIRAIFGALTVWNETPTLGTLGWV